MGSSELEHRPSSSPRRLGRVVVAWVGAAVAAVAGGVTLALWGLGLTGRLSSSTGNVLDIVKLAFAFVAGVGGTLGLVLAYRRHLMAEEAAVREAAKESREDTKLFNERFKSAAEQLGSELYAVKLAGVYAMAGLADDWAAGRQTCIDVLCANVRRDYPAEPNPETAPTEYQSWRDNREFRHTIIAVITTRLREDSPWQGHDFDFRKTRFDGGDFVAATFSGGFVDFGGAQFCDGDVDFSGAQFSGDHVSFRGAQFSGGTVNFFVAQFSGAATISDGNAGFRAAQFSGGFVNFGGAQFSGGTMDFSRAQFSDGTVNFGYANFSPGTVNFTGATFSGSAVNFTGAKFSGGTVNFSDPRDWSVPPSFPFAADAVPAGVLLPPGSATAPD